MAIKGILFDKDGTLIDVNRTWVPMYRKMLAIEFGTDNALTNELLTLAGFDATQENFRPGSPLAGGTTRQIVSLWWPKMSAAEQDAKARFIDSHYAPMAKDFLAPLMPLKPILESLTAEGYILGVGTNDSFASADGQVQAMQLSEYFKVILGSDSVKAPKPSGDMISAFANFCGIKPSEVAMVGDNTHDLEEAKHGGAGLGIGVLSGNSAREHLQHLADHIIDSVADLPLLLKSL
jgi:phosphoglycolate phosphatase